ncbi:MAG: lysophospholipid acyltransferase family protein [Bacteroidota bacterium]
MRNLIQGEDIRRSMKVRRRWANNLFKGLGVVIETEGTPPNIPCLLVSNHRSYMDPILMLRDLDAWPVAKAEIASWPVIGKGADMAGILYVRREHAQQRSLVLTKIAETVAKGFPVILFPEGTTCDDPIGTVPFKTGGFRLAVKEGIQVVPVSIYFPDQRDFWVGDESFIAHASRRFRDRTIRVKLCYGPILSNYDDASQLMSDCKDWIEARLRENHNHTTHEGR